MGCIFDIGSGFVVVLVSVCVVCMFIYVRVVNIFYIVKYSIYM